MSIKKWVLGVLVFVSLFLCVKVDARANMAEREPFWNEYDAVVINPDGIGLKGIHIPYGATVKVYDEYESGGHVYVYIEAGKKSGYISASGNIERVDTALSESEIVQYTVFTYAETNLYSLPTLNAQIIRKIPAGVELSVTYENGPFGYVQYDDCSGWVIAYSKVPYSYYDDNRSAVIRATVMVEKDFYSVMRTSAYALDDSYKETKELIPSLTEVHIIGRDMIYGSFDDVYDDDDDDDDRSAADTVSGDEQYWNTLCLAEVNGKKVLLHYYQLDMWKKYKLHISSPDLIEAAEGMEGWKSIDTFLHYEDELDVIDLTPHAEGAEDHICLYGDDVRIRYTSVDNLDIIHDYGCFLVGAGEFGKKKITVNNAVDCNELIEYAESDDDFGDYDKKRGTISAGTKVTVYCFPEDWEEYEDEPWESYVEGYGWAWYYRLTEGFKEESKEEPKEEPKEESKEEPAVEEPKEEPKVEEPKLDPTKVVLGEGESKTDERRILNKEFDIFAERELINKIGTIEQGKEVIVHFIYPNDKEKAEGNFLAANIADYGWVELADFLTNSSKYVYENIGNKDTKAQTNGKTLGEFSTTQTRVLDADITCYVDWTLQSLNLNSNSIKAGQEVTVTFRYSEGSADDERNFTNAVINGYLWVNVKELLAKSHVSVAKTEEESKVEEPKVAEPESVTSPVVETPEPVVEPVTPQKQLNPVSRTLIICLAFAVVIAGAAVFGIVKLSKKKKEDK